MCLTKAVWEVKSIQCTFELQDLQLKMSFPESNQSYRKLRRIFTLKEPTRVAGGLGYRREGAVKDKGSIFTAEERSIISWEEAVLWKVSLKIRGRDRNDWGQHFRFERIEAQTYWMFWEGWRIKWCLKLKEMFVLEKQMCISVYLDGLCREGSLDYLGSKFTEEKIWRLSLGHQHFIVWDDEENQQSLKKNQEWVS